MSRSASTPSWLFGFFTSTNANGIPFHLGMRLLAGFPLGNEGLPGLDGYEIAKQIRLSTHSPISRVNIKFETP